MTAEVEQRIVEMRFDNEQFEKGAKQTLKTLEKLDNILDMLGSGGGMDHLSSALDAMEYRFSRLGIAGAAAIERISGKVIGLASNILTAIPDQIISGGTTRALNIENAKFQLKGLGIAWEEVADDIDHAVMGTAYGVDEAAKAAAILGASNVQYKNMAGEISDMGHVLRSISGIAAMTNSSYDDIANVMGDIFAMGRVTNGELQRFELRGLNVVAKLAEMSQNGTLKKIGSDAKYTETEMRELISNGGMDALTFAKAMDLAFGEHATAANETYTGSLRNMKAALSRIGADFVAGTHEGSRKIFLEARGLFDRVRKITKPFAEGRFAEVLDGYVRRISGWLSSFDLRWLQRIRDFLEKSNSWTKPIDWFIDRLYDFNEISKRLFGGGLGREGIDDKFGWVFDIKKNLLDLFPTLKKAKDIFSDFFKSLGLNTWARYALLGLNDIAKSGLKYVNRFLDWFASHSPKISKFLSAILYEALNTEVALRQIAGALLNFGISVVNLIGTLFSKSFSKLDKEKVFKAYHDGMWKLSDALTSGINKLTEWINKLSELIEKGPAAESTLGKIAGGFETAGSFIGGAINGISTFLSYILGLQEGETVFTKLGNGFKFAGTIIRNTFAWIRDILQKTFGEGGIGKEAIKVASAFYTALIGYRQLETKDFAFGRFGRAVEFLKEILTGVYDKIRAINPLQWADDIETLLRRTSGSLRAFSDNLNAKSLIAIGGAVVTLAFGLTILAHVAEGGHLAAALTALTMTMGLLIASLWAIKAITSRGLLKDIAKGWKGLFDVFKNAVSKYFDALALKETASALMLFSVAVGILALAVIGLGFAFSKLKLGSIVAAVVTVGLLTVLLTGMLVWITKATSKVGMFDSAKFMAIAVAFIGIALAVDLLALAVAGLAKAFDNAKVGTIIGAIGTVIVLMVALVGAMVALSAWTKETGGMKLLLIGVAMVAMALAIDLLAIAVVGLAYAFQGLDSIWPAIGAVVAIGVMLMAMAGTLAFLSSMLAKVPVIKILAVAAAMDLLSGAILIVAAAAIGFAAAMQMSEEWWHVLATIAGILLATGVALGVLSLLGPKVLIAAVAILGVGFAIKLMCDAFVKLAEGLVVLAGGLNMLPADGSLETIGKGLGVVAGGLAKIAGAALFMPSKKKGAFDGLISLGTAMTVLEDVDIAKLADKNTGLPALAKALREAFGGDFFGLFGSLGGSMAIGNAGLLGAGPALTSLGAGLQSLTPGLNAFATISNPEALAETIKTLADAVLKLSNGSYFGTKNYLPNLADNLVRISSALGSLSNEQVTILSNLGSALSKAFEDNSGEATNTLSNELDSLNRTLEEGSRQFSVNARHIPMNIQSGIEDNTIIAVTALKTLLWKMSSEINTEEQKNNWKVIGGNIAIGIANGITSRTAEAANAMTRLASALQRSFTVSLAIRSPSRVFESLAGYIPKGIARGIQNGESGITDSLASSMSGAMNLMDQYSRDASNFSPQISPVMDMNAMRKNFNYAERMVQSSGLSGFNGLNGLTVHGDAISYNMQNRDVVNEIKNMSEQIIRLGEAIENMQMVLDSGVLVGQIGNQMNRELGAIAMRERRQ